MISWLQLNLQKHFRVVFIVLLVGVIVSFVFTIGNQPGIGGAGRARNSDLRFFETELNTQAKQATFSLDAQISAYLNRQQPNESYAYERATALHIATAHGIPQPNHAQREQFVKELALFQGPQGEFDPKMYDTMLNFLKMNLRASDADVFRVLQDDYRARKVMDVLSASGFVPETVIMDMLQRQNTSWDVMVATFDMTSYTPEVQYDEAALQAYFEDNKFKYETPERRSVNYVAFDAADFQDQVQHTEDDLISFFEENIDQYQPAVEPKEGEEQPEPVKFEDVRTLVRQHYKLSAARSVAQEKAHDLILELLDKGIAFDSPGLDLIFKDYGLEKQSSTTFAANETPVGTVWGKDIVEQAFQLSEGKFYSEPFQVGNQTIVIFFKEIIEPTIPAFDTLITRVAADYTAEELRRLRNERSEAIREELVTKATDEENFGAAAEEVGLKVETYRDFTLSAPAKEINRSLLASLNDLDVGQLSDMISVSSGKSAAMIYVLKKDVPEVSADDADYAQTKQMLESFYGRSAANQYISALATKEMERLQASQ